MRIGEIPNPLFRDAANTPRLHAAYDALVGPGRWLPRDSLGTFPIRFPSPDDPGDCGWHVDMSFGMEGEPDFAESSHRPQVCATGAAGTVYLCHPFLVHAAQPLVRGERPRFLAQPPLLPSEGVAGR